MIRIVVPLLLFAALFRRSGARRTESKPALISADSTKQVVVIYNESDPDSAELARFYAEKRGIPKEQIIGLKCATTEEITREEYDETIAEPLREAFEKNCWWKLRGEEDHPAGQVEERRFASSALMRGVPLKIKTAVRTLRRRQGRTGRCRLRRTTKRRWIPNSRCSACLTRQISGAMNNPYYRSFSAIADTPIRAAAARLPAGCTDAGDRAADDQRFRRRGADGAARDSPTSMRGAPRKPGIGRGRQMALRRRQYRAARARR